MCTPASGCLSFELGRTCIGPFLLSTACGILIVYLHPHRLCLRNILNHDVCTLPRFHLLGPYLSSFLVLVLPGYCKGFLLRFDGEIVLPYRKSCSSMILLLYIVRFHVCILLIFCLLLVSFRI